MESAGTKVFAPIFVGRPPSDAYIGLARLPSGEIRHYNYGEQEVPEYPMYILSRDGGFTWQEQRLPEGSVAADQRSPVSGEYIRLFNRRGGKRVLVACQFSTKVEGLGHRAGAFFSDDDGLSWKLSNLVSAPPHKPGGVHRSARWQVGACEPTVVELKDGRILLLWNNTTPLPEVARDESLRFFTGSGVIDGSWEDVFTNRDAIHAAVSDDEGKTWRGFREMYLNPRRNDGNFAQTGGIDRSVHQSQFAELDNGVVLVSLGQHWLHRSLVQFHPDWLLEKARSSSFENGLDDWSVQTYIAGIRGHCAFNRKAGADLIEHPGAPGKKVLRIRKPRDRSLVTENQGAVWNFPSAGAGSFTTRVMLVEGGQGGRIGLLDRWVNPTDLVSGTYAMFTFDLKGGKQLQPGRWRELKFEWNRVEDPKRDTCRLSIDGILQPARLRLNRPSVNGISYVHFVSTAASEDTEGFLVESVSAEARLSER